MDNQANNNWFANVQAALQGQAVNWDNNNNNNANYQQPPPPFQLENELDDTQKQQVKNSYTRFLKSIESTDSKPALRFTHENLLLPDEANERKAYKSLRFASKIGGMPFWPAGKMFCPQPQEEYEESFKNSMGGKHMRLAIQINLQDIPTEQREALNLPCEDAGILQFYISTSLDEGYGLYGGADTIGHHVVYFPKSVVDQFPVEDALADLDSVHPPPAEDENFFMNRARPLRIDFDAQLTTELFSFTDAILMDRLFDFLKQEIPETVSFGQSKYENSAEFQQMSNSFHSPDARDNYLNNYVKWQFCQFLQDAEALERGNHLQDLECSKLGGKSYFVQDDPRLSGEQLLQLASSWCIGAAATTAQVMIGDCGTMQFYDQPHCRKRGDFGGVSYYWACS